MLDGRTIYQEWRNLVQNKVAAAVWNATLSSTRFVGFDGTTLLVGVPSQVQFNQINSRHMPLLEASLREVAGDVASLRIEINTSDLTEVVAEPIAITPPASPAPVSAPRDTRSVTLDDRMTFENFVEGPSNNLARAASLSAAELPGRNYNPLFIYGGSGLGKTHLLHAIGHYVKSHWPEKTVLYVTTETFLNDFIRAVREQTQLGLHDRYRSADVLLVDDIQFMLTRSENFQEHVFNTFNSLLSTGKQLVLSSDQSPRNMSQLQDRLRSRLLQGLIVEVNQPDFETRVAILEAKAEMERVSIPRDVIDYIANRVRDSIRELEGSVTMLRAHSQLLENEITLDFAKKYLGNLGREQAILRADDIIDAVAARFGFTSSDITGHARVRPLAHARHIAMYLVRDLIPNASYPVIARQFGNRNHTSVISAVEKIKSEMSLDAALTREITELRRELTDGNY